jgi:hypothetical protein
MANKKLIDSLNWVFAKSMPEIPHEYVAVENYPKKAEVIAKFIDLIEKNGYTETFNGKEYKYLEINGYKYWVVEDIINREKL